MTQAAGPAVPQRPSLAAWVEGARPRTLPAAVSPVLLDEHPDLAAATEALTGPRRYLALVPTQLHRMLRSPREVEALVSSDCVLLGGSAAPLPLLKDAREVGVRVVTTYGMS